MIWVIFIFTIVLFIFIIVLTRPLRIACQVCVFHDEQFMVITATFCKMRIYQKEWSIKNNRLNENLTDTVTMVTSFINTFGASSSPHHKTHKKNNNIKKTFHYICKNSILHHLSWVTTVGTGSASATGMIAGGLWTIKQTVHMIICQIERIDCQPELQVNPDFQHKNFSTQFVCIISMRLVKAIFISRIFSGKMSFKYKNN